MVRAVLDRRGGEGMKEYIDRKALIAEYDRVHQGTAGGARKLMVDAPAADVVEVIHGEWEAFDCISESKRGRTIHYATHKCSVCKKWNGRHAPNYCPRCGAKMNGVKTNV